MAPRAAYLICPQRRWRQLLLVSAPVAAMFMLRVHLEDHAHAFANGGGRSSRHLRSATRGGVLQGEPGSDSAHFAGHTGPDFEGFAWPAYMLAFAGVGIAVAATRLRHQTGRRPKTALCGTAQRTEVKTDSADKENGNPPLAANIAEEDPAAIAADVGAAAVSATKMQEPKKPKQAEVGEGLEYLARWAQVGWETFVETSNDKKEDQNGFEYRKGIEGMSMGSLHYEMLNTEKDSNEYKELQKKYEGGWGVPFVNVPTQIKDAVSWVKRNFGLDAAYLTLVNFMETLGVDGKLVDGIPVQNKWMQIVSSNMTEFADPKDAEGGKKIRKMMENMVTGQMERIAGAPMPVFLEGYGGNAGIYKIVIGPRSVAVVSDPVILRHILTKAMDYNKGILSEVLEPIMGKGLIPADPATWRTRRRAITPGFHKKWLEQTTELVVGCAESLCDELEKLIVETKTGPVRVNMEEKFTSASLDIIGKAIFDYDFGSTGRESPVIKSVYSVLREAERRAQSVIPYWNLPGAAEFFRDQKTHEENLLLLNAVLDELIRNAMEEPQEGEYVSMLQFLVMTKGEDVTTRQLRDDLMTLLIAGHETTAALLTWTLHELMKPENKEILDELVVEIDEALGGSPATFGDTQKMPLLRNCLMESLRLYPQPPLLIRRCENGDENVPVGPTCQDTGDTVSFLPGQDIFISTWSLHRSVELWGEDAAVFNPRRWDKPIPGKGAWNGYDPAKVKVYPNEIATDFAFVPFGGGARKCVGDQFALLEAEVVLTSLLQRFTFTATSVEDAAEVGMTTGATIHTTGGLNVDVKKRLDPPHVPKRGSPEKKVEENMPQMEKKSTWSVAQRIETGALVVPTAQELNMLFTKQFEQYAGNYEPANEEAIEAAYVKCREITREHSKTFFLGSQLLAPDEQRVVWAIYNWCRSTDELVDGPDCANTTMEDLEVWEQRLNETFKKGAVETIDNWEDLALADSVRKFSLIERPFQDMVGGMAMDLVKERYETFQELEVYCYRVAGTVGLMTLPVLGFDGLQNFTVEQKERTIAAAMSLGVALQLTNILRDVGEDARRNRIYVPTEDLHRFGITHEEVMEAGHKPGLLFHEARWKDFMEFQMERCERFYVDAEQGIVGLSESNRMGVMAALFVYRGILPAVRRNNYDNFSQRAYVDFAEKMWLMGQAWWRCQELKEVAKENIRTGRIFSSNKRQA